MKGISSTTKLALDLTLNGYKSGHGMASRGKDYCTDFTYKYDKKKELTIPYEAYKLLDMSRELIFLANNLINANKNTDDLEKEEEF